MTGTRTINFTEEKIILNTETAYEELRWSAIEKIRETKDHLFIFVSVNQAILIPKRIFSTEDELNLVKQLILSKTATFLSTGSAQ
jgi:hypothetical protein